VIDIIFTIISKLEMLVAYSFMIIVRTSPVKSKYFMSNTFLN